MAKVNKVSTRTFRIRGEIFSGSREGVYFTALPWVKRQIKEKLGFVPYPGTLNLRLSGKCMKVRKLLESTKAIEISPELGYCGGKCFKAYIGQGLVCAVVLPCVDNYPKNVLEIIAPSNLRETLKLKDGDELEVRIALE